MKIVHIILSLQGGGKERRLVQLVKGLNNKGIDEQYIIILKPIVDYKDVYGSGAEIITLNSSSTFTIITSLYNSLKNIRPDIVHLWTGATLILVATSIFKTLFHYRYVVGFLADGNPLPNLKNKIACQIAYRRAEAIISNSKAGLIAKSAIMSKSHVFYNGFDFSRFKGFGDVEDMKNLRQELNINTLHIVSMVARFHKDKDFDSFIQCAKLAQDDGLSITFLAVGQGEMLNYYKQICSEMRLKNILFTGFRTDVLRIVLASDVCLLFTNEKVHAEGVSNSVMEAMAAAKPVIASRGGGTSEIIEDGVNGFIVSPGDYIAAYAIIKELIAKKDLSANIGKTAKEMIKTRFMLSDMSDRYFNLYNNKI